MPPSASPDPEKLDKFLEQGGEFFSWNKGKNTPNILLNFAERLSELQHALEKASNDLQKTLNKASESSAKLASALNMVTLAGILIGGANLVVQLIALFKRS
jgi:hypothetical protein